MANVQTTIPLPHWLVIELEVITRRTGVAPDEVLTQALRRYIEREGRQLLLDRMAAALCAGREGSSAACDTSDGPGY